MKKMFVLLSLITAVLVPVSAQTTGELSNADETVLGADSLTIVVDEMDPEEIVADTVPARVVDSVSGQTIEGPVEGGAVDFYILKEKNKYREYHGPDFHFFKNTTNPAASSYSFLQGQTWTGIPVFLAGWAIKGEKEAFRQNYRVDNTKIRLIKYNFHTEIDNYTQFAGIGLTVGLKLAGVEGRSSWPRLAASSLASYAVMAAFVNGIKYTAGELRPDESTKNSWPSGHTATAFVGATILHKEYGLTRSPWYSIAGYTVATATGVMRVLNNRHWVSDVLSGAGIGILSTELAYGICDLLFKNRGLLMNDFNIHADLSKNPSFFSVSMGIGFGNKNLTLPAFDFEGYGEEHDNSPMYLQFGNATAVGAEAAYFFNRYVGVGARLRVKATPIKKWSSFATDEEDIMRKMIYKSELGNGLLERPKLNVQSDHITEFAADAGLYINLPLSSRFAFGTKILIGRSVMDDVDVDGHIVGYKMRMVNGHYVKTDEIIDENWDYINLQASNSYKFGSGISATYAYKNSFSWRLFLDYDYTAKTYTAFYSPLAFLKDYAPQVLEQYDSHEFDPSRRYASTIDKQLHQWVLGGALCVSF